jgi:nucleoid-associated protein YgaU
MTKRTPTPAASAPATDAAPAAETPAAPIAAEQAVEPPAPTEQPAAPPAAEEKAEDPASAGDERSVERIHARVLVAFDGHEPNDVVELTEDELIAHGEQVDPSPAAVEYARSLQA